MNPDKLFDYLEDRLPAAERAALEERLMSDKQLQRELAVARQIHAGMRGDSREVLLPPQPDVTVPAATGKLEAVANEVVTIASRFGGSAAKGLPDQGRLSVLVDLPSNREPEFRAAISSMVGEERPGSTPPAMAASPTTTEKKSFDVQIVEQSVTPN